jgi:hypothetical protein
LFECLLLSTHKIQVQIQILKMLRCWDAEMLRCWDAEMLREIRGRCPLK